MGIGTNKEHVAGRTLRWYWNDEGATPGTFAKPAATDAMRVESSSIKHEPTREPAEETSIYADEVEMETGRKKVSWSVDMDLRPSGVAATPPTVGDMLTAACGVYTNHGGTHCDWSPAIDQSFKTGTITRWMGEATGYVQEAVWGAYIAKMGIKLAGGKKPSIHFEGGSIGGYVLTGHGDTASALVSSDQLTVDSDEQYMFGINSVVQVAALTNTGAGYRITAGTASPFTLEATLSCDDNAIIAPYAPTPTYSGSPLMGISGAFTLAAQAFPITAFDFDLDCNLTVCDDHVNTEYPDDLIRNKRKVTGKVDFRVRKDLMKYWLGSRSQFSTVALLATCGSVAGSRFVVSVPQAELQWSEWSISGDKELTISVPYRGLGTSAGNNSFEITQN
jgi:hypothetical protein